MSFDLPQAKQREQGIEDLDAIRQMVAENATRIAVLGKWPEYVSPEESLTDRVPKKGETHAPGFDAGVACALDLIPREKQELAATLHANYSQEIIEKMQHQFEERDPNSETTWWLAGCRVCGMFEEGSVDEKAFLEQVRAFQLLAQNEQQRLEAAEKEFQHMKDSVQKKEGVPFGAKDGCIQGAYIAGFSFGSRHSEEEGLYFIGTYEDSLGLEDFVWSDEKDADGEAKSGPVHKSKQYVQCSSEDEWRRAIAVVRAKLGRKE